MTKSLPLVAATMLLPACGTIQGAASDARVVGSTAVQMVRDIPDIELPALPELDASPFSEVTEEVRIYCDAINARWKAGKEQVAIGEQLLAEGQSRIEQGQANVRDGDRRIATGELMLEEARRELSLKAGRVKPEARDFAQLSDPDLIKSIRVKMEQALRRLERGGQKVEFGAAEIELGHERMADGIDRLKQGHALLAEDEGRCRNVETGTVHVGDVVLEADGESQ